MESFVLSNLQKKLKLSSRQFGGIKGSGVDHFLTETWHEVIQHLEHGGSAESFVSIDFSKAFNRMDHGACIVVLRAAGVDEQWINVTQAFLFERLMAVHVGDERSDLRMVPGGSPQGSVLGCFLFCATTDSLSEGRESRGRTDVTRDFDHNGGSPTSTSSLISPIAPRTPIGFRPENMSISSLLGDDSEEEV